MTTAPRILLVEDDARLAQHVRTFLERHGFRVHVEHRGDDALTRFDPTAQDVLVLDWGLPGVDGLSLCRALRPRFSGPIVLLTARQGAASEVAALEAGADDYLAKPVRPRVLLARLLTRLRTSVQVDAPSSPTPAADPVAALPGLEVDTHRREVRVDGRLVSLTTAEFDLLRYLVAAAGRVVSRDELSLALRGVPHDGLDRTVDLRVAHVRRKLGDDPRAPRWLKTVRGAGYLAMRS